MESENDVEVPFRAALRGWRPDVLHADEYHYGNDGHVWFLDGNWFWQVGHVIPATRWDPADWEMDYEDAADSFTEAVESVEWILAVEAEDQAAAADAQAEAEMDRRRDAAEIDAYYERGY